MTKKRFDAIIIGAGSIGVPTALALAEDGIKCLVIEKKPSVGQGANKCAIGGIRAAHSDPAKIRLCLQSIDIFSNWKKRFGDDIEWRKAGYSFVAYHEKEETTIKKLLKTQKEHGLNISWLSADEIRKIVPDLNPDGLRGGSYSPDDGNASPLLSIHAFYTRTLKLGTRYAFNEEVTEILREGERVTGVRTNRDEYHSKIVINAGGANARQIAALSGIDIPVFPDSHEAAITEPVAHFLEPMIVDIHPAPGSNNYYFYQHKTGQVIFCITPEPGIPGEDTRETSSFLPMVSKRILNIMPRLQNIRVRRTWRGLYPMTPDGFPIIGKIHNLNGFIQAVGMCGQGFMLGPGVGMLLKRLIMQKLSPEDEKILEILSPYRKFDSFESLK